MGRKSSKIAEELRFQELITIRLNQEIREKIVFLLDNFPEKFTNESHLIRCAILNLYNKGVEELKIKHGQK